MRTYSQNPDGYSASQVRDRSDCAALRSGENGIAYRYEEQHRYKDAHRMWLEKIQPIGGDAQADVSQATNFDPRMSTCRHWDAG